jgi:hypothetical protein
MLRQKQTDRYQTIIKRYAFMPILNELVNDRVTGLCADVPIELTLPTEDYLM